MDLLIVGGWLFSGFIGCLIGEFKDRKGAGLLMGLLLGPLGWILILFDVSLAPVLALAAALLGAAYLVIIDRQKMIEVETAQIRAEGDRIAREMEQRQRVSIEQDNGFRASSSPRPTVRPSVAPRTTPTPREIAAQIAEKYRSR